MYLVKYLLSTFDETVQKIDILNLQIPILLQFNLPIKIFRFSVCSAGLIWVSSSKAKK